MAQKAGISSEDKHFANRFEIFPRPRIKLLKKHKFGSLRKVILFNEVVLGQVVF